MPADPNLNAHTMTSTAGVRQFRSRSPRVIAWLLNEHVKLG
jgi:hypothetical protein